MSLFISLAQVVIFWSLALVFLRYRLVLVDHKMPLMQFGCISFFFFTVENTAWQWTLTQWFWFYFQDLPVIWHHCPLGFVQ